MKERIEDTVLRTLFRIEPVSEEQLAEMRRRRQRMAVDPRRQQVSPTALDPLATAPTTQGAGAPRPASATGQPARPETVVRDQPKVGRNDPCPCGSGKKYKKCHGQAAAAVS
jgi:preprotein translocase subunit SecA